MSSGRDPIRDLNNYLQGHPSGNLTHQLSWELRQDGPQHQRSHFAIAKFRGIEIGHGRGTAASVAKRVAATPALQWLQSKLS